MSTGFDKFKAKFDEERDNMFADPHKTAGTNGGQARASVRPEQIQPKVVKSDNSPAPVKEAEGENNKEQEKTVTYNLPLSTVQTLKLLKFKTDMSFKELLIEAVDMLKNKYGE